MAKLHKEDFQAVDIAAIASPVTKWPITVMEPAPGAAARSSRRSTLMRSGRPGPVLIDLPLDVQLAEIEFDIDTYEPLPVYRPAATRGAGREGARPAGRRRAAADRGRRRHHQRRRRRPAGRARRAAGGAGRADADGLGCDPGRPPADGRHGRDPDVHRYGNATLLASDFVLGIGNRWANRHTGGLDAYRAGASSSTSTSSRPRSGGSSRRTTASCPTPGRAGAARRGRRGERAAGCCRPQRLGRRSAASASATLQRRTDFDDVPIKPQRVYEEMNRAFGRDVRYVTAIGLSQIAGAQFLHVYRPRHWIDAGQAGPLGWAVPAALGVRRRRPGRDRGRAVRRLRLPVPDRGAGGRRPVQHARTCTWW